MKTYESMFIPITMLMEYPLSKFEKYLKDKMSDVDINSNELTYIFTIYSNSNISQRELADLFVVSEAYITKITKTLEKKGYVERKVDEKNKSKKLISLTSDGEKIAFTIYKHYIEWEGKLMESFSPEEWSNFKRVLYLLTQEVKKM